MIESRCHGLTILLAEVNVVEVACGSEGDIMGLAQDGVKKRAAFSSQDNCFINQLIAFLGQAIALAVILR